METVTHSYNKHTGSGNRLKNREVKSKGHIFTVIVTLNLFSAALHPTLGVERVSVEWCTLVTDQTSGAPKGNGIDTATCRKMTKEEGGKGVGVRSM